MQNHTEEVVQFFKHQWNDSEIGQNILLIWLDINIVKDSSDYLKTITPLRSVVNTIETFTDSDECIRFIKSMGNKKACMLVSGSVGQYIVPRIHDMPQVDFILVFCGDLTRHRQWAVEWPKIYDVFNTIAPICEVLNQTTKLCEQNAASINTSFDQSFLYTRILKETFLTIKFEEKHIAEFCNRCCTLLAGNEDGVKNLLNLERNYHDHSPIWWYTSDCLLRSVLNCALKQMNVVLLARMGFFIGDLHRHIEKLYREQYSDQETNNSFTVYRGQGMPINQFEQMKEMTNGFISFNNFLSTDKNRNASLKFAEFAAKDANLVGILFRMDIDPSNSTVPFASTKDVHYHQKRDEILFSMHTVFRIDEITPIHENQRIFQVNLTLSHDMDEQLSERTDRLREEVCPHSTGWYQLGLILLKFGQYIQAEQIFETLLDQTTDHHKKASIYNKIGKVKHSQGNYQEAIRLYVHALDIYKKLVPPIHSDVATSYYNIGLAYEKLNEHSQALSYHEKALEMRVQSLPPNHLDLACSYREIGRAYCNVKEYPAAVSSHEKALAIQLNSLLSNHPDLVSSYDSIGEVYRTMKKYFKAISFYEKSLAIREELLPPNHPKLAMSYNEIGEMCYNVREFTKALGFYEKALNILQKSQPPNYSDLVMCYGNIGLMHENIGDYLKAHAAYERAVNIGEKVSSLDRSLVEQQRQNFNRVKKQL